MNIHTIRRLVGQRFRRKRMKAFTARFAIKDTDRILDIGGYPATWKPLDVSPSVLMVNLEDETWEQGTLRKIRGDGRALEFPDNSFDIAYSNSVIEHLAAADQPAFAREVARVATRYYVQTPYKWFFIESHFLGLFIPHISWLPRRVLRQIVRYCSVWGLMTRPAPETIDQWLDGLHLLDVPGLQRLFPDAEIQTERFLGMTKSLIAIRA